MNQNKEKKFFELAKNASKFSDFNRTKMGSVIVSQNRVLAIGWNSEKETALQKKYNKHRFDELSPENTINKEHAEIAAVSHLLKEYKLNKLDLSKCHIFVYREHKSGEKALARPCKACEAALRHLGIKSVFYTGENSFVHEVYD